VIAALLGLFPLPTLQDPAEEGPSAALVAETQAALEEAFRSDDVKRIQGALEAAQAVPHPAVVELVASRLRDERKEVRLATLTALRWMEHRDALEALQRLHGERKWLADPELALALLRGIGQHADPSSIRVLAHDPFDPPDHVCWRARIFGLARIRTRPALEALFTILGATGGGAGERRVAPLMGDVRIALILLTGVDQGLSPELWERWWRQNKKDFRLAPEPPLLPKELRAEWDKFWGLPPFYGRERRREDRGREPPPPRAP
jgi:hypothetical protein